MSLHIVQSTIVKILSFSSRLTKCLFKLPCVGFSFLNHSSKTSVNIFHLIIYNCVYNLKGSAKQAWRYCLANILICRSRLSTCHVLNVNGFRQINFIFIIININISIEWLFSCLCRVILMLCPSFEADTSHWLMETSSSIVFISRRDAQSRSMKFMQIIIIHSMRRRRGISINNRLEALRMQIKMKWNTHQKSWFAGFYSAMNFQPLTQRSWASFAIFKLNCHYTLLVNGDFWCSFNCFRRNTEFGEFGLIHNVNIKRS